MGNMSSGSFLWAYDSLLREQIAKPGEFGMFACEFSIWRDQFWRVAIFQRSDRAGNKHSAAIPSFCCCTCDLRGLAGSQTGAVARGEGKFPRLARFADGTLFRTTS